MKHLGLILSLLIAFQAHAQGQQDEISKAMADVNKVDDPLTKALNESDKSQAAPAAPAPAQSSQEAARQKYDINSAPSMPADAAKKVQAAKKEPLKLTKEESDLLKSRFKSLKDRPDLVQEIEQEKRTFNPVYSPSKARSKSDDGYIVERDSSKVVTKNVSVYDAITLKMCFSSGVQIVLDEDIATALQTILLDDKIFFDAIPFDNNRGAYVRLKQQVPAGSYWESAARMVRKADDKTYLINLIALPCPEGAYPFPKVVYLKEKYTMMNKTSKIMTPENTIIGLSEGYPRLQKNIIRVRDMVATSGAEWATFGVEIQFPNRKNKDFDADMTKYFKFLDNLQVSQIPFTVTYLPIQSDFVTKARGVPTMRFEIKLNINKSYMINNQYLYMMFLDKDEKHYQYVKIDTLPYFLSLKQRGFEL